MGWTHAAHSIALLQGSGRFSFRVPRNVWRVAIGLSAQDASQSPDEASHGFLFRGAMARIMESGALRGLSMPYADTDFWHIVRIRQTVYYCRADVAPATEAQARAAAIWISGVPSGGPVLLDATLFAPGDEIRDAEIADLPDADPAPPTVWRGIVAPLGYSAKIGPAKAGGGGRARLVWPMAALLVQPQRLALVRAKAGQCVLMSVGSVLARLNFTLPAIQAGRRKATQVRVLDALLVRDAAVDATYPGGRDKLRIKGWAGGRWVSALQAGDALRLRDAAAAALDMARRDVLHLRDRLRMEPMARRGDALLVRDGARAGVAALHAGDVLRVGDDVRGHTTLHVSDVVRVLDMRPAGQATAAARSALLVRDAAQARGDGALALKDVLLVRDAALGGRGGQVHGRDTLLVHNTAQVLDDRAVAWVMNAQTGAVCWWQNWQFVDAVQLADGRVLAVGPQGVSEWVGQTDEDEPVHAHVTWGLMEMGGFDEAGGPRPNERLKRMTQLTVGYHAEQALQLTVHAFAHGQTPVNYTMPPQVAGRALWHRNHRLVTGRGMRARYWRMQLAGQGPFQVHGLTADMATSTRRM